MEEKKKLSVSVFYYVSVFTLSFSWHYNWIVDNNDTKDSFYKNWNKSISKMWVVYMYSAVSWPAQ